MNILWVLCISIIILLFNTRIRKVLSVLRYKIELGGKDGFRVGYPGRFLTPKHIFMTCLSLNDLEFSKSIYVPDRKSNDKFDHSIRIKKVKTNFHIELLESTSQSYLYCRNVNSSGLKNFINNLYEECNNPKSYDFVLEYF